MSDVESVATTALRQVRKIVVAVVGFSVLFVGIAMMVLPGPAVVVIPAGLAILALEFVWARTLLKKFKEKAKAAIGEVSGRKP